MWKVLGLFEFDLTGKTAFSYASASCSRCSLLARRIVSSPFGLSLRGIREGPKRMPAIGSPVPRRLVAIFTVSAAMAGVAGALLAQTTQFVGIDSLGFPRSAELLVMLVLGGVGRLYGAHDRRRGVHAGAGLPVGINPVYWQFWIGILLIVVVLFARGGIMGRAEALWRARLRRRA